MLRFLTLSFAVTLCGVISQDTDRNPICRQIKDVFSALCVDENTSTTLQRPPWHATQGKKGPRGEKGDTGIPGLLGDRGPPGIVDYELVNLAVNEKIAQELGKVREVFSRQSSELTASLARAESRIRDLEEQQHFCQVKYQGRCFWVHIDSFDSYGTVTYSQTEVICRKQLASPANIYSEQHYEDIYGILAQFSPYAVAARRQIRVWTGMRFNTGTFSATLANGTTAPFTRWYQGNPTARSSFSHIGIDVYINRHAAHQHMYNWPPTNKRHGVICEK